MWDEAHFTCAFCGEINYIELDPSAGFVQDFIEDCQVCCQANQVHIVIDPRTLEAEAQAEMEEE